MEVTEIKNCTVIDLSLSDDERTVDCQPEDKVSLKSATSKESLDSSIQIIFSTIADPPLDDSVIFLREIALQKQPWSNEKTNNSEEKKGDTYSEVGSASKLKITLLRDEFTIQKTITEPSAILESIASRSAQHVPVKNHKTLYSVSKCIEEDEVQMIPAPIGNCQKPSVHPVERGSKRKFVKGISNRKKKFRPLPSKDGLACEISNSECDFSPDLGIRVGNSCETVPAGCVVEEIKRTDLKVCCVQKKAIKKSKRKRMKRKGQTSITNQNTASNDLPKPFEQNFELLSGENSLAVQSRWIPPFPVYTCTSSFQFGPHSCNMQKNLMVLINDILHSSMLQCSVSNLRPIVIDGSNVARLHGQKDNSFSCKGIALSIQYFQRRGHRHVTAMVPQFRRGLRHQHEIVTDRWILEELAKRQLVVFTPSRTLNGRLIASYDDRIIVDVACQTEGIIVSNDNLRDVAQEREDWRKTIEQRLLMFCFVGDVFTVPDDPCGRNGPRLQEFLSFCKT